MEPYSIYIPDVSFEKLLEYADEDLSCELLDGVLVIHSPASFEHETIFKFIITLLELYSSRHELGTPIGSRFIMKLDERWSPEPDILFLSPSDQKRLKENYLDGPATVVFEILSKTTREDDLMKKLPQYLAFDVKEVWIIDPREKTLEVHWAGSSRLYRGEEWALSREIAGFRLKPQWLWGAEKIPVIEALNELETR